MNQFAVQPNSCGGIWIPGAAEVLGIERRSYLDALLEVVELASFAHSLGDDANVRYVGLRIAHRLGQEILLLCNVTEFSWL